MAGLTEKDAWTLYKLQCEKAGARYEEVEPWAWEQLRDMLAELDAEVDRYGERRSKRTELPA